MQEVLPSIWKVQGTEPGPTLTITGGIHGNEKTGIEVVSNLRDKIDSGKLKIVAGTLYLAHGNLEAMKIPDRGTEPHLDLNRSFPLDLLDREPDGTYEDKRAREIAPIFAESDYLVDLHATNKPSEPFLAGIRTDEKARELFQWYECKKILIDTKSIVGGAPVTTDEYCEANGGIGIAFETGQADDVSRIAEVENMTMNLLKYFGFIEGEPEPPKQIDHEVFELTESILLTESGWEYAQDRGNASWEPFTAGTEIGRHGDIPLIPDYNGVIVFPKMPRHRTLGKPVGYLAKKI